MEMKNQGKQTDERVVKNKKPESKCFIAKKLKS